MSERFVVIGAGTMGAGIAYVAAGAGYAVQLVELDANRAAMAVAELNGLWAKAVDRGRMTATEAGQASERLSLVRSLDDLTPGPTVIVEAVPERLNLKIAVLAQAATLQPELLASNTSSIPISALGKGLPDPTVFCGLHFFNPVFAMPLLEIVIADATSELTRERALAVAERLGKDPVVVRDMPGFATSRLGVSLGLEAIRMVEDGVASAADIDKAMKLGYRHPMGPLELTDIVGLDVRLDIAHTLQAAYGDRFAPPELLVKMVAEGKLGKKSGEGFHKWPKS